jgi:hypothetical protein
VSEGEKENKHLIESHPLAEQRRREAKRNSPVKAFFNQCFKFNII